MSSYIKNSERSQINNNPMVYPKDQGKQEQVKPKSSIKKEIIKIRAEINAIKSKRAMQREWSMAQVVEGLACTRP
jgi:hypothetical protein